MREWRYWLLAPASLFAAFIAPGWAGGSGMCMTGRVPEPASGAILALGVAGILWYRRRRNRR